MGKKPKKVAILDLLESKPGFFDRFWEVPSFKGEPNCNLHRISFRVPSVKKILGRDVFYAYGAALEPEKAVIGCLGEAVERYAGYKPDIRKIKIAAWGDLKDNALHPDRLAGYSAAQFKRRSFPYTPFTEKTKVAWIKGNFVRSGNPVWIPTQAVYLAPILPGERRIFERISTGLAAGSSMEQAILHGLYEVVEHDAFTITWLNHLSKPVVDWEEDSWLFSILSEQMARPHLYYTIVDITSDLGIPTYLAMIRQKRGWPYLSIATCTRLNGREAVVKSAIEALVSRTLLLYHSNTYPKLTQGKSILRVFRDTELENRGDPYAEPRFYRYAKFLGQSQKRIPAVALPNDSYNDIQKDLDFCLSKLAAKGFEPIVVDLTTKEIRRYGLTAVKVIIPGLSPLYFGWHYARLKNRRLYEAPVAMGYRKRPSTEKEIYQIPHPLM